MAGGAGALFILVDGDVSGLEKALKKAGSATEKSSKKMETSLQKVQKAMKLLQGAMIALGGLWAVREITRVSDAYTLLDSKLKLVTDSTDEATKVWSRLYDISQDTGTSFRNNAQTFVNMQLNIKDVGVETETTLQILDSWTKSLIINGSTQREATSATLQFKQALSSGRLAGEEFRGVSEGNAYWMTELAKVTGRTVGELRELSMQQMLTRDFIVENAPKMAASVNAAFGGITKTIERSMNELQNVFEAIFADSNKASQATENLAIMISDLAGIISDNKDVLTDFLSNFLGDVGSGGGEILGTVVTDVFRVVDAINELKKISDSFGGPSTLEYGIIGFLLIRGKSQAAVVIASLAALNEALGEFNLNIGNLKDSSEYTTEALINLWKALGSQTVDPFTGAVKNADQLLEVMHDLREPMLDVSHSMANIESVELDSHFDDIKEAAHDATIAFKNLNEVNDAYLANIPEGDFWKMQFDDAEKVAKRVTEAQEEAAEATKKLVAEREKLVDPRIMEQFKKEEQYMKDWYAFLGEQLPKDSWMMKIEGQAAADARALEMLGDATEETTDAMVVLWEQFVQNVGDSFEGLFKGILTGELNTFEDVFRAFGDTLLNIWIDLVAKIAANSLLDVLGLGSAGSLSLGGLFGGGGSGGGGGGGGGVSTAVSGAGAAGGIASWFGLGKTAVVPYGTLTGEAAASSLGVTTGSSISGSAGATTLGGGAAADTLGTSAGMSMGAGLAIGASAFAFIALQKMGHVQKETEDLLNENLVQPFHLAAVGIGEEFTDLSGKIDEQLAPALKGFESASIDTANGILVLGNEIMNTGDSAEHLNTIVGGTIQKFDASTGAWSDVGISMVDLTNKMYDLAPSTREQVEATAQLVAVQAGLPSIADELEASYYAQGNAMKELTGISAVAARAFQDAGGAISSINWQSIPSDQHYSTRQEIERSLVGYAHGTPFVPVDGPAYLHQGEAVLTKEENQAGKARQEDILVALTTYAKKTADILKRLEKTGLPTSERTGVYG